MMPADWLSQPRVTMHGRRRPGGWGRTIDESGGRWQIHRDWRGASVRPELSRKLTETAGGTCYDPFVSGLAGC